MRRMSISTIVIIVAAIVAAGAAIFNAVKNDRDAANAKQETATAKEETANLQKQQAVKQQENDELLKEIARLTKQNTEHLQTYAARFGDDKLKAQLAEATRAAMDVKPEDAADFVKRLEVQIKSAAVLKKTADEQASTRISAFELAWKPAVEIFRKQLRDRLAQVNLQSLETGKAPEKWVLVEPVPSALRQYPLWVGGKDYLRLNATLMSAGLAKPDSGIMAYIYVALENRSRDITIGRVFQVEFYETHALVFDEMNGEKHFNVPKTADELKVFGAALKAGADKAVESFSVRLAISGSDSQP